MLTGGLGSDEIYGGPGDDYVVAAPATVGEPGSATDVLGSARDVGVLPGAGSSPKLLVGGTGSDRIYGSDGAVDDLRRHHGRRLRRAVRPGEHAARRDHGRRATRPT